MSETLPRTKFLRPPAKHSYVLRSHLIDKFIQGLKGLLTLVSAPAGYGKTILLSKDLPEAALLTLDSRDNNPACFWSHVFQHFEKRNSNLAKKP
jgi:LuxR family maltose regulon positive regulatory protein